MSSPAPRAARISIIGGGPGGLTCARILQRHGVEVSVYEHDTDAGARNQGGTLDLRADDGQIALRRAGLLDEFFTLARPEGQENRNLGLDGTVLRQDIPAEGDLFKPEIDRGRLRTMLLGSLRPSTVRWGHTLKSVSGPVDGPRTLHFADGTTTETDLVIGADGAFSRVRPAVSATVPRYTGITFLEAWFDDVDNRHAELSELVGQGLASADDGERRIFAQRNSDGHIRAYLMQHAPVDWITSAGLNIDDTDELRAHLLEKFATWSPRMQQMITDNDGPYVDRPIFVLPAPFDWNHNPAVTLLGDAAHLMPPFGVGANLAMLDASDLAFALTSASTVDDALDAYEKKMFARANKAAEMFADFLIAAAGRGHGREDSL
ncbi:FAD-dependent monooxygenase [Amycolatopsis sp. H6(2020)]|nr:FAD-dependent monooxygenase [Amycolatopsis sp. H6(2020)]